MKDRIVVIDQDVKFELQLSDTQITYQEENPSYKDSFSTKFSFPFEFHLDRDLRLLMGDYSSLKVHDLKTLYENCYHIIDGEIRKAQLIILGSQGEVVKAQIDSGFEQFPNWDKKLRDLPLETVHSSGSDMIAVADKVYKKTYPEVNYNFPMIHTDIYKEDPAFESFLGTINLRKRKRNPLTGTSRDVDWINNQQSPESNIYLNKNIIQPLVYWMYVLKVGFEDAGFSLHGDVLSNSLLQKMMILPAKKVEIFKNADSIRWVVGDESRIGYNEEILNKQPINLYGRFKVRGWNFNKPHRKEFSITWFNTELWRRWKVIPYIKPVIKLNGNPIYYPEWYTDKSYFSFEFTTKLGENILEYNTASWSNGPFLNVEIIPLELYDENGKKKQTLADFTTYNLAQWLPDRTFGDLVTVTKNLFNFDISVRNGTEIWMNYIDNVFSVKDLKDISNFEISNPQRKFEKDLSFLLKYKDRDTDEYKFTQVYFDRNGMQTESGLENKNTKKIEIDALPLPLAIKNEIKTAHQFFVDESTFQICLYDGTNDGENTTDNPDELSIDRLFTKYWYKWLRFRINTSSVQWKFYASKNQWKGIKIGDLLYAYNQKLIIKNITKTSLGERMYEIDMECDVVRV